MGQRQNKLREIINNFWAIKPQVRPTSSDILSSKYSDCIFQSYSILNGQLSEPPTKFGAWDIPTEKFIIELDEERHFNRYRLETLKSSFYKGYNNFSVDFYQQYCKDKETACLKTASWGKNWQNNSTEKQFSKSEAAGILTGSGSSRWKQRALYDFLKDISSKIMKIPVIRISIYETYANKSIDLLLKGNQNDLLLELINNKIEDGLV